MAASIKGVTEETTTGVHRLYKMLERGELLFPAINVNDSVTKSKFDNLYGCRHSLIDAHQPRHRRDDRRQDRRRARLRRRRQGLRAGLRGQGARVIVTEIDPDQRAAGGDGGLPGRPRWTTSSARVDIFVSATGNADIITVDHMAQMKHNAIVCNIGHFDNEIDMAGLARSGAPTTQLKPGTDLWTFPDGHAILVLAEGRLVNLGCATGHPSFVMSCSFSNQVLAQMELFTNADAVPGRRVRAAEAARREGGRAPPRRARREAHQAHRRAGRVPRRRARRPLQARPLPLLTHARIQRTDRGVAGFGTHRRPLQFAR